MRALSVPLATMELGTPDRSARPHAIEHLEFDFAFSDEAVAFDLQQRVCRFAGEYSPRVIDELFSEWVGPDAVLQLDRLEIDLGVLPLHEVDSEWEARLRDALHQVLQDLSVRATDNGATPQAQRRTREEADFEALWGWLTRGTLPWQTDATGAAALDTLVARVLTSQAPMLAKALADAPDCAQRLRRVARQWRSEHWLALGQALAADPSRSVPPPPIAQVILQPIAANERTEHVESWLLDLAGRTSPGLSALRARPAQDVPHRPAGASEPTAAEVRRVAEVDPGPLAAAPAPAPSETTSSSLEAAWHAGAHSPEAARQLIAHVVDAMDRDPGALQSCMLGHEPTSATWIALMRGLGAVHRQRLLRLRAAPGGGDFLVALSDSAVLQSLSKAATASDREHAVWVALALALRGGAGVERSHAGLLESTLTELRHGAAALLPRQGIEPKVTKRELAALLSSSTLRQLTPAVLLHVLDTWVASGADGADPRRAEQQAFGNAAADWRERLEHQLAHARLPRADLAWTLALRHDPAWLMQRLRHHGRRADWRRRFDSVLTAERWDELLGLWVAPADRSALARRIGGAQSSQLRQGLLGHLLLGRALGLGLAEAEVHLDRAVRQEPLDHEEIGGSLEHLESRQTPVTSQPEESREPSRSLGASGRSDGPRPTLGRADETRVLTELELLLPRLASLSRGLRPSWNRSDDVPVVAELAAALDWLQSLPEPLPAELRVAICRTLEGGSHARLLFGAFGPARRRALLKRLRPREGHDALATLAAWQQAGQAEGRFSEASLKSLGWRIVVEGLFEEGREFSSDDFTERWRHAMHLHAGTPEWHVRAADILGSATEHLLPMAEGATTQPSAPTATSPAAALPNAPQPAWRGELSTRSAALAAANTGETLYVSNAGMVLFGPYLPRLWSRLKLTEGDAFVSDAAADRSVHILQWLVSGQPGWPESALVLNKLMCGIALAQPIVRDLELGEAEIGAAHSLLEAVIQHWRSLGRTSVAGLRQTFLQREGALTRREDHWHLMVAPGPFDMLLDQLPWGYKTLRYPWMSEVLHVQWR